MKMIVVQLPDSSPLCLLGDHLHELLAKDRRGNCRGGDGSVTPGSRDRMPGGQGAPEHQDLQLTQPQDTVTSKVAREARNPELYAKLPDLTTCTLGPRASLPVGTSPHSRLAAERCCLSSSDFVRHLEGCGQGTWQQAEHRYCPSPCLRNLGSWEQNGIISPDAEGLFEGPFLTVHAWQTPRTSSKVARHCQMPATGLQGGQTNTRGG